MIGGSRIGVFWIGGPSLRADDFPPGTPLRRFFAWNEARRRCDRRWVIARDLYRLRQHFGSDGLRIATGHLAVRPVILRRRRDGLLLSRDGAAVSTADPHSASATAAARNLLLCLDAALGSPDAAAHAAVFAAFDALEGQVDLEGLAQARPRIRPSRRPECREILVVRLSALGDFVQALGPAAAIRQHHAGDRITLLTTPPLADFAAATGLFDAVLLDRRPGAFAIGDWIALRGSLRGGHFDRVYDLQTSERSGAYAALLRPGLPEWSGIAAGCSHPHADLDRNTMHTIDIQAEQLMMAGIYPTPLPGLPRPMGSLPTELAHRPFALLVPGSSPRHPAKRWPPERFGALATALAHAGLCPVVVGSRSEQPLAALIRKACPAAVDLTGRTDLVQLAALAQRATVAVGNDTGVSHLAAAAGCPVVVLFSRASDPARCAPRGRDVRVIAVPDLVGLTPDPVIAEALAAAAVSEPVAGAMVGRR